jgi:hypothetical protein
VKQKKLDALSLAVDSSDLRDSSLCGVYKGRASCETSEWNVPKNLKDVYDIAHSSHDACALDREGLKCWSLETYDTDIARQAPKDLVNPRSLTIGAYHGCVIDGVSVRCWPRSYMGPGEIHQPTDIKNPRLVVAGAMHTCAVEDDIVRCWGMNDAGQATVPDQLRSTSKPISMLRNLPDLLAAYVYDEKQIFLKQLKTSVFPIITDFDLLTPETRLLVLLTNAWVQRIDSEIFKRDIAPSWSRDLEWLSRYVGNADILAIPKSSQTLSVGLRVIGALLQSIRSSLAYDSQKSIDDITAYIGVAVAKSDLDETVTKEIVDKIIKNDSLLSEIENRPEFGAEQAILNKFCEWLMNHDRK